MPSFVKIHSSILDSTMWTYDSDTRVIWITMLVMCDQFGSIESRAPGIAKQCGLPLDVVIKALNKFLKPDKYSRTQEYEGRRIEETSEGYTILNYPKYREKLSKLSELERKRKWAAKNRETKKQESSGGVDGDSASRHKQKEMQKEKQKNIYSNDFDKFWAVYPRKVSKGAAEKAFKSNFKILPPIDELVKKVEEYAASPACQKDGGKYIKHPSTWLNGKCWEDEITTADNPNKVNYER